MKLALQTVSIMTAVAALAALCCIPAQATLPPPSDEAKAKAAEAAAKTKHGNAEAAFKLCKFTDALAARYTSEQKKAGKAVTPTTTPPCTNPGPFVYPPPATAVPAKKS